MKLLKILIVILNVYERISKYSKTNCLKLNAGKSKYIIIGSRQNLKKLKDVQLEPIKIDSNIIEREYEAKNLGVTFDEELTWTRHVNLSVAKAYGKLKQVFSGAINFSNLDLILCLNAF